MTQRVAVGTAQALITSALRAHETSIENAEAVARGLIAAEKAGQSGHGLRRVASYAAQAASGKVDGRAVPTSQLLRPGSLSIDAAGGFAYPALELATGILPSLSTKQGVAVAGIRRSHHCGVAGVTVEALAQRGSVAMMFANTPAAMAPWGGTQALFGTNPIAFAAPSADGPPVVVDLSLSKVARGKVMAAAQRDEAIPGDWGFNTAGEPTTDAQAVLDGGTMAPAGDAKGAVLALMIEMLCAGLIGGKFGYEASSFFDAEGPPPGVGQLILAFDPGAFGQIDAIARFDELARMITEVGGTRVPGRRRADIAAQIERDGIAVDADVMDDLRRLANGGS